MCRRMVKEGLVLKHLVLKEQNNARLIVTVGASPTELRKEAARIKLPMRMQDTMGACDILLLFCSSFAHILPASRGQV